MTPPVASETMPADERPGDGSAPGRAGAERLSDRLEGWLQEGDDHTIGSLTSVLDERSFALVLLVLMLPSALPLPTGGVTHVLELFSCLVAVQMVFGREELWLPRRMKVHELGATFTGRAAPALVRRIRWFERFARPRLRRVIDSRAAVSLLGVSMLLFVLGALLAPPFSGLDTLPSLGVVLVCLGLVFSDALFVGAGVVVGAAGIAMVVFLGSLVFSLF
jgi:hypothetical protein